jgi:endonuclease-3
VNRRAQLARRRALAARPRRLDAATRGKAFRAWERLEEAYPEAECALRHENPFQLLVATILSAQCTDARVNLVTPALFRDLGTPRAMAEAPVETIEEYVRSTGFFRNKARNLKAMAQRLVDVHGGEVPRTMEALLALPGVARKTANVILGTAFGVADGVVVDTHVHRLSHRLGWSNGKTPVHVERDLMALFPRDRWIELAHTLIQHGRRVCLARKPRCPECPVKALCPSSLA